MLSLFGLFLAAWTGPRWTYLLAAVGQLCGCFSAGFFVHVFPPQRARFSKSSRASSFGEESSEPPKSPSYPENRVTPGGLS